jgi:hypothetical protein
VKRGGEDIAEYRTDSKYEGGTLGLFVDKYRIDFREIDLMDLSANR